MPEGPFGGPRITEVGPFSSDDVEVEETYDVEGAVNLPKELKDIIQFEDLSTMSVDKYRLGVTVKQKVEDPDSIMGYIQQSVADFGESVAYIRYYVVDGIGYIDKTFVKEKLRREGLGSAIRSSALEDMENLGVEKVYTLPISPAGEGLAKSQGFVESDIPDMLVKRL